MHLSTRRSYRLTVPGGYQAPDGTRWSSSPFDGGEPRPPKVLTGRVRSSYVSVTGATCYVLAVGPRRSDTAVVVADTIIEAVAL